MIDTRLVKIPSPPKNQQQLLERAHDLAGFTLGELADELSLRVPANLQREKGWVGMLIETALGATAGSKPQQDFPELGIELKTIPLSYSQQPLETTYVCYAPLTGNIGTTWQTSNVKNKLRQVLWLPIQGEREIPIADRMIGRAILWEPSAAEEQQLKSDWEELMDMICLGRVEKINASVGQVMQLRPKAANGSVLTDAIGENGKVIKTRPRGFYLRKNFTASILKSV